jgi:hypothetical protein
MAERAAIDIQVDAAEWRPRRQRHDIDRGGCGEVKFAKRGFQHAAFRAARNKSGRLLCRNACRRRIEHGAQLVRIVGLDDSCDAFAKAERGNNLAGHFNRAAKPGHVMPGFCARQHRDTGPAISKDGGDGFRPELRHFIDAKRQHLRRQTRAEPGQRIDDGVAVLAVMEQHDGIAPASLAIRLQQRPQPPHQRVRVGQRIGRRARRTYRSAGAAARAYIGVDDDCVAVRRDRAGRTQIETARAAGDAGTRMGAERGVEIDEARLVKGAHQIAGIRDRAFDRGAIARIGTQISRTQLMRGKQRRAAVEIEDQIAGRGRAVARRSEHQLGARGGQRQRIVVDEKLKRAEMSARVADRALENGKLVAATRRHVPGFCQQHRDVETVGEALRRLDGDLVATIDQRDTLALQRHH